MACHPISGDSLNAISTRASGMVFLGRLLAAADTEGGPFPPVGRFSFGLGPMARECGVSRTQLRRILLAGAGAGHFVLHGEGEVELTQRLADHIALLGVAKVLSCRWAARRLPDAEKGLSPTAPNA